MASVVTYARLDSPVGPLLLTSDGVGLTGLYPETHRDLPVPSLGWHRDDRWFSGVADQLQEYFRGRLTRFQVPLALQGTPFQRRVWELLLEIPFGGTATYGALAVMLDKPKSSRAVGLAVGRNPVSFIVPCHRVIGSGGGLVGYASGLPLKERLLTHEQGTVLSPQAFAALQPAQARRVWATAS